MSKKNPARRPAAAAALDRAVHRARHRAAAVKAEWVELEAQVAWRHRAVQAVAAAPAVGWAVWAEWAELEAVVEEIRGSMGACKQRRTT
jgi:hypothetical protein